MQKYLLSFGIGFVIGILIIWAIGSNVYNKQIERLSNTIAESERINTELQGTNTKLSATNTRLIESNRQSQATIGNLEKQLRDRDNYIKTELDKIRGGFTTITEGLGQITTGLEATGTDIQGIIDGLGQIKDFIKNIKWDSNGIVNGNTN